MLLAALRHRPRQSLVVLALAAVVGSGAAIGPLYSRAVEQSVLRTVAADATPEDRGVAVSATGQSPPSPRRLREVVAGVAPPAFGAPVPGADVAAVLTHDGRAFRARLVSRDGLCRHVRLAGGRCLHRAGEALVSRRSAQAADITVGTRLPVRPEGGDDRSASTGLVVVGIYELPDPHRPFWSGRGYRPLSGSGVADPTGAAGDLDDLDDLLTRWSTLTTGNWPRLRTHLDIPLHPGRLDVAAEPSVAAATDLIDSRARTVDATATSTLDDLLRRADAQRRQARAVVPLLTLQLAGLGLVVLAFLCAAVAEQRRPEIALARLRGFGTLPAAGLLGRELVMLVLVGTVIGAGVGWLVCAAAGELWLAPGVALEARWPVAAAVAAAAAAGVASTVLTAVPTLRQPIVSLLRRVPPRTSTLQVGLLEGGVVVAAVAGVVTLQSGDGGPVALLAPGLLALAGGLLISQLLALGAGPAARRGLSRGRLRSALAGLHVARRPALRRLVTIVTVACALLAFATNAWSVSARNRTVRAEVDTGAAVVLSVDAESSRALRRALTDIDPRGRFATPVVTVRSATESGPRTTAVDPGPFGRIANWGGAGLSEAQLARLVAPLAAPVRLKGSALEVTARLTARAVPPSAGSRAPELEPFGLRVEVAHQDGSIEPVHLGRLRPGVQTVRAALPCMVGCLLRTVTVTRTFGDFSDADVTLEVLRARTASADGSRNRVDLDPDRPGAWQSRSHFTGEPPEGVVQPGRTLRFRERSYGVPVSVQRGDLPVIPTAIVSGAVPGAPGREGRVLAPELSAGDSAYTVVGRVARVPRAGTRGVLVDLAAVANGPSSVPAQTAYEVWLAADDPEREDRVVDALDARGLAVIDRASVSDAQERLGAQGPTLALRLALLSGCIALLLAAAALVVGVATSGPNRARDLAALRVAGVPAAVVRSAAVREHVVVVVLGALAGCALGLLAAHIALPQVPLTATRAPGLPLDLRPAWLTVTATAGLSLAALGGVAVVVGRGLAARATADQLRESR